LQKFRSPKESSAELSFGEYNTPNGGENLLGSLKFRNEELYSVGKPMEEVFWLPVDSAWFKVAEQLKVSDIIPGNSNLILNKANFPID